MANNKDMYIELANRIYDLDGEVYKCVGSFPWKNIYRKQREYDPCT